MDKWRRAHKALIPKKAEMSEYDWRKLGQIGEKLSADPRNTPTQNEKNWLAAILNRYSVPMVVGFVLEEPKVWKFEESMMGPKVLSPPGRRPQ